MEILAKILGNPARVKVMRLFLVNRSKTFAAPEVIKRSRVNKDILRKELNLLSSAGFIKKRAAGWSLNPFFGYLGEFENLLIGSDIISPEAILDNFKKVGKIRLFIISGIFIKSRDSRADLLIVGDRLKRGKIEEGIKKIEAEIGGELTYVVFDTKEFLYRLDMYDKLVRDILDFPHEVVLQSRELSAQILKKA
ncbi:MAG: hypothetical protein M3M85_01425 [bacterium]|nr:hypothetical protein [bacterium]